MRLRSIFFVISLVLCIWVIFPSALIYANDILGLGEFNHILSKILGIIFVLIDAAIFAYCTRLFSVFGKGSPILTESTKKFVGKGLYSYVRNPIYIGHTISFIGFLLYFGRPLLVLYPILGFAGLHVFVIRFEEPDLKKRYRKTYIDYTYKVKRWGLF